MASEEFLFTQEILQYRAEGTHALRWHLPDRHRRVPAVPAKKPPIPPVQAFSNATGYSRRSAASQPLFFTGDMSSSSGATPSAATRQSVRLLHVTFQP